MEFLPTDCKKVLVAKKLLVANKVIASQTLGVALFWKVSGLSKGLLSYREDATVSGLGSLCFDTVSEREEMWKLIDSVFKVQCERERKISSSSASSPPLKTADLSALWQTLNGRYPFLLHRVNVTVKLDYPKAKEVPGFLKGKDSVAAGPLEEGKDLRSLPKESLSSLLGEGGPDVWVKNWSYRERCNRTTPLLVAFLAVGNLDCAEALLDASARVDVCEWWGEPLQKEGRSPLHALLEFLIEAREGGVDRVEERQRGLCLLGRLAKASQEADCLGWDLRVGDGNRKTTTALGLACIHGDADAVRELKEEGATAQHTAAAGFLFMAVNGWEEYLPRTTVTLQDPSLAPSASEIVEVVKTLERFDMVSGGDVNKGRRADKHCPLSLAVSRKPLPVAEALLDLGAVCLPTRPHKSSPQAPSQSPDSPPTENHNSNSSSHTSPVPSPPHPPPTGVKKEVIVSPLRIACDNGDPAHVRLLCDKGKADPNLPGRSPRGGPLEYPLWRAVQFAAMSERNSSDSDAAQIVKTLFEFEADFSLLPPQKQIPLRAVTVSRLPEIPHTLLTLALSKGCAETARALCEGSSLSVHTPELNLRNPLIEAMASREFNPPDSNLDILPFLPQKGADPNRLGVIEIRIGLDKRRKLVLVSPLLAALLLLKPPNLLATVKLLIEHGARCLPPPPTEETPSPFSSSSSSASPALPASSNGVSVQNLPPISVSQVSPLLVACTFSPNGEDELPSALIRLLCLEGGADPNVRGKTREEDRDEATVLPLIYVLRNAAARYENPDKDAACVLSALLDGGADPDVVGEDGESPLSLAQALKFEKCAEVLQEAMPSLAALTLN